MSAHFIDDRLDLTLRVTDLPIPREARRGDEDATVDVGPCAMRPLLASALVDVEGPETSPVTPPPPAVAPRRAPPEPRRFTPTPMPPQFVSVLSRGSRESRPSIPTASSIAAKPRPWVDTQRSAPVPRTLRRVAAEERAKDRTTTMVVVAIWALAIALMGTLALLVRGGA